MRATKKYHCPTGQKALKAVDQDTNKAALTEIYNSHIMIPDKPQPEPEWGSGSYKPSSKR